MRGIEESDVHAVCDRLLAAGDEPSVRRLHHELGKGSYTTIARHLRTWRTAQERAAATPTSEHPQVQALAVLAPEAWSQAIALARSEVAEILAKLERDLGTARRDLASAEVSIAVVEEQAATSEAAAAGRLASAMAERDAERQRADRIEAGFARLAEQMDAWAGRLAALADQGSQTETAVSRLASRMDAIPAAMASSRDATEAVLDDRVQRLEGRIDDLATAINAGDDRLLMALGVQASQIAALNERPLLSFAQFDRLLQSIAAGDRRNRSRRHLRA